MPTLHLSRAATVLAAAVAVFLTAADVHADQPPGFDPKRHMTVDEVQPGMTGYGLTVYHGTKIEPFAVEVVSVQHGFQPGKSVVWIRCPDERMQLTGPVQGMSGSPIFLWPVGKEQELGKGGRMIGAFAFGHRLGKDCYAGVQPITQMLETAARAKQMPEMDKPLQASAGSAATTRDQTLAAMYQIARENGLDQQATWRLDMLAKIVGSSPEQLAAKAPAAAGADASHRLMLPVAVGSAQQAAMLSPLFNVHGLAAQAAPVAPTSVAPNWIKPDAVKVEPGGVFAVPLTFGPMELAAIGTTTEVLPDGTALAFGHQFFAQGPIAVPMAPGFVHFVQPNLSASFKLGGSLDVTGAVVRDETSAIVGKPGGEYPTVPATVRVRWPGSPALDQDYNYQIVHHERLLPSLVASVAAGSLVTDTELPMHNTLEVESTMNFADGRALTLREMAPNATAANVVAAVVPPMAALIENDFTSLKIKSIDTTVRVRDEVLAGNVLSATLDRRIVAPGDKLVVHVRVMPFRKQTQVVDLELKIPKDVPDGQYMLSVGGSRMYATQMAAMRPHLMTAENDRELFDAVQTLLGISDNALYAVLALAPGNNLAIGRSELPQLPGSRLALLQVESSTRTSPYLDSVEARKELPLVIMNEVLLPVTIQEDAASDGVAGGAGGGDAPKAPKAAE